MDTNIKQNPDFSEDFAAYLRGNGFRQSESLIKQGHRIYFFNEQYCITITGEQVAFSLYHDGEAGQTEATYSEFASFCGLSQINTFGWMMLLDMLGVIKVKNFMKEVRKDDKINSLFKQVHKTLAEDDPHEDWFQKMIFPGISNFPYVSTQPK